MNCAALPPTLIAAELFGHEKGAFTGASQRRIGRLETAHGGTIFLDEIGDLPLEQQAHLLRFLQEGTIDRVGGRHPIEVNARVICATNVDLGRAISEGRFREDLYYRLHVLSLHLPNLRARGGDIELLATFFLRKFAADHGRPIAGFSDDAWRCIREHTWPGNVRELISSVRRAIVMADTPWITARDLGLDEPRLPQRQPSAASPVASRPAVDEHGLRMVLARNSGNVTAAARELSLSRMTLFRLEPRQQRQQPEEQKEALRKQQHQLDALRSGVDHAQTAAPAAVAGPVGPTKLDTLRGAGEPQGAQTAQAQQPVGQPPAPLERPPEVNVLSERGGVLTPKGALVFEPALDFSHTTDSRAIISGFTVLPAILVGNLDISRVNHDVLQAVSTFRYGLTNRAEIEVRVPYVYGRQETTSRPQNLGTSADTTNTITGHGLGDVELAGHYQFNSGQGGSPFFIGNLRFKSRTGEDTFQIGVDPDTGLPTRDATGSGFYNLEPSLTAIYPRDPAVFFANVGYLYGFERHVTSPLVGDAANIKPA